MNKRLDNLLNKFINNEDIDEGNDNLRAGVKTLEELRYILAVASQEHADKYDDVLDALISL